MLPNMPLQSDEAAAAISARASGRGGRRIGSVIAVLVLVIVDAGCRRNRDQLEEEIPPWLREHTTFTERTIQPEWFNAELRRLLGGTKRVRILRQDGGSAVAIENSADKIAALVSRLQIAQPAVDGPGRGCRCTPDLYLEFETPSGKEVLSPVCGRGLRLGTLRTGVKWPDPVLTPAARDALKNWVEERGVAFECCGERGQPIDGTRRAAVVDGAAHNGVAPDERVPAVPARR
jgi:hypothetical protein